ncbi:M64 family metallopeptidase [Geofilum rubicundum]|uniref:Putative secreted protein n=1 Tax=Geofilum rubicundum JCM 15548 TaxID=1236989 RepID=A0A0E9M188_9BACT|nr:M64 family metallopeptidase [Geofilum rubicundum]GAO30885.1 putative secreted protein [Geofilum rubicundum JCM 15548]
MRWNFRLISGVVVVLCYFASFAQAQNELFDWDRTLRVDFVLVGNLHYQNAYVSKITTFDGVFAGSNQMISPFDYGEYRYFLIAPEKGDTLFKRGFSTLFEEWRTIDEARDKERAFQQSIEMPMPLIPVKLVVESRLRNGKFVGLFQDEVVPDELSVVRFQPFDFPIKMIHGSNDSQQNFDVLFLAEGYQANEADLFFDQVEDLSGQLLATEPYQSLKDRMAIRAIAAPSVQSGPDDPRSDEWRNTIMESTFNTFGVDRYLETEATWKVYDLAAQAPHDHIIVLVNSDKYGGGGIYNHFSVVTAGHRNSGTVLIHELGHGFGGLGDEYFGADVSYNDFINPEIEPWQPNLTTLVDFDRKWKHLVAKDVPVPTPIRPMYKNTTGVFEGGGYVRKGVYRPAINCRMRTNEAAGFCEVCTEVLTRKILFHAPGRGD